MSKSEEFFKVHPRVWHKQDLEELWHSLHQFATDYTEVRSNPWMEQLSDQLEDIITHSPEGTGTPLATATEVLIQHHWYPENEENRAFVKYFTSAVQGERYVYLARMDVHSLQRAVAKYGEEEGARDLIRKWNERVHRHFNEKGVGPGVDIN